MPAKNEGENNRLYQAVKAASDFAIALGINIPTGKDSLSMTQKYPDGKTVFAPGTVIISAIAEVENIQRVITPVLKADLLTTLVYIDFSNEHFQLGGSAFAQTQNKIGSKAVNMQDAEYFSRAFNAVQTLLKKEKIIAGHDISSGGLITSLLEMCFAGNNMGLDLNFNSLNIEDTVKILFSENPSDYPD